MLHNAAGIAQDAVRSALSESPSGCEETCMDVRFDAATEAFRQEIRAWLAANVPKEPMPSDSEGAFHHMRAWQKKMFEAGWAGIHWPRAYGGRGATLLEQAVFQQELARAQAPPMANTLGLDRKSVV